MNRSRVPLLGLLLGGLVIAASGCGPRIGVVDSQRVLNESVLALSYQKQIDDREKLMLEDLRLLSGQLSKEDLAARRQTYLQELATLRRTLEGQLDKRLHEAVAQEAHQRRLQVVLVKQITKAGGIDITDAVLAHLK